MAFQFTVAAPHVIQILGNPGDSLHRIAIQRHRYGHENARHQSSTDEYPAEGVPADGRAADEPGAEKHHQSEGLEENGEAKLSTLSHGRHQPQMMGCGGSRCGLAESTAAHRALPCTKVRAHQPIHLR